MGRLVQELAAASGCQVTAVFDSRQPLTAGDFRVAIDFTVPSAVLNNVRRAAELGIHLVVGTTGWQNDLDTIREIIESSKIGLVYGANFSVGVNLFFRAVRQAAEMLAKHPE